MPDNLILRPRVRSPGPVARYALLAAIAAMVLFNLYVKNIALSRDVDGMIFVQPPGWSYHSETAVIPHTRRIHFTTAGFSEAVRVGQGVPLFVLSKYPATHPGANPIIGVNVYQHASEVSVKPERLLELNLAQVQAASQQALQVVEPIGALPLATLPAARVVLSTPVPADRPGLDRLTVYALVAGHMSFTIIASGAAAGDEAIDSELAAFIASLAVD